MNDESSEQLLLRADGRRATRGTDNLESDWWLEKVTNQCQGGMATAENLWALWHPPELDEVMCPLESVPELPHRHQGPMRPADDYHTRTKTSDKAFKHCHVVATVVASAQPWGFWSFWPSLSKIVKVWSIKSMMYCIAHCKNYYKLEIVSLLIAVYPLTCEVHRGVGVRGGGGRREEGVRGSCKLIILSINV